MLDSDKAQDATDEIVRKLLKRNPQVDAEQFHETRELVKGLRRGGVARRGYDIASPYERRPLRHKAGRYS